MTEVQEKSTSPSFMVVLPIKLQHCDQTPWLRFDLFGVSNALVTTWTGLKKEVLIGSFECSLSELLLLGEMTGRITANGGRITARVMGVVEGGYEMGRMRSQGEAERGRVGVSEALMVRVRG